MVIASSISDQKHIVVSYTRKQFLQTGITDQLPDILSTRLPAYVQLCPWQCSGKFALDGAMIVILIVLHSCT